MSRNGARAGPRHVAATGRLINWPRRGLKNFFDGVWPILRIILGEILSRVETCVCYHLIYECSIDVMAPRYLPCSSAYPPGPKWNNAQSHVTWPFGSKTRKFSTDDAKIGHLTKSLASFMYVTFPQIFPKIHCNIIFQSNSRNYPANTPSKFPSISLSPWIEITVTSLSVIR